MIEICIETAGEDIRSLRVSGHGGKAKGRDIVCSAVSAITQTALTGLLYYAPECIEWKREGGALSITVGRCGDRHKRNTLNVILSTMSMGLKQTAGEYPDRVKLRFVHDPCVSDEA